MLKLVAVAAAAAAVVRGEALTVLEDGVDAAKAAQVGGWKPLASNVAPAPVHLTVALKAREGGAAALREKFFAVSMPESPEWRQFLTVDEANALTAPAPHCVAAVTSWLRESGVPGSFVEFLPSRDYVQVSNLPAATASQLLGGARFETFATARAERTLTRTTDALRVPHSVASCVDFVSGATGFPVQPEAYFGKARPANTGEGPDVQVQVTPAILIQRYNVTRKVTNNSPSVQAVAEFQGQFYSPNDLDQFFQRYDPSGNSKMAKVVGQNDGSDPGVEASLDTQYIMTVANAKTWFYSFVPMDFCSDLVNWAAKINGEATPPHTHSVSYGAQQAGFCSQIYERLNQDLQKLGVKGLSIQFSSGDSGSGFNGMETVSNFPAESPYVTSIGATRFLQNSVGPEGAVQQFGSGGGFSKPFNRIKDAPWQQTVVKHYLDTARGLPQAGQFNADGRATPDFAALGIGFQVINGGQWQSVGGTSASTPTVSALITLLNDQLLSAGKKPLGFVAPYWYHLARTDSSAFFDVTVGNNNVGGVGYPCQAGYDAVTGMGTPNFKVISAKVGALPY